MIACVGDATNGAFELCEGTVEKWDAGGSGVPVDLIEAIVAAHSEPVRQVLLVLGEDVDAVVTGRAEEGEKVAIEVYANEH